MTLNPAVDHFVLSENFVLGGLNRVHDLERHPGGKGINIAIMLGVMGTEVIATGFLGRASSQFVQEELHQRHVTTNFVHIDEDTRHNYFIIDEATNTRTLLDEEGPEIEPEEIGYFKENYKRLLRRCSMVVLAGSIPKLDSNTCIYCELMDMANEEKIPVILNAEEALIMKCMDREPFIIMPDTRSADYILGEKVDEKIGQKKQACQILAKQSSMAILTFDGKSYVVTTREGCYEAICPDVEVVSMLKTDDAMIAGLIYGFREGLDHKDSIRWGAAASTAASLHKCSFIENKNEVERHLDSIIIKEV